MPVSLSMPFWHWVLEGLQGFNYVGEATGCGKTPPSAGCVI